MDANQPYHYGIWVYDKAPPPAEPVQVSLCPRARTINRATLGQEVALVTCRRCRELLDVLGLR